MRIWRCKNLTRKLRQKAGLPLLYDEDDLPDPMYDPNYVHVLSDEQEKEIHHRRWSFLDGVLIGIKTLLRSEAVYEVTDLVSSAWHAYPSCKFHLAQQEYANAHQIAS